MILSMIWLCYFLRCYIAQRAGLLTTLPNIYGLHAKIMWSFVIFITYAKWVFKHIYDIFNGSTANNLIILLCRDLSRCCFCETLQAEIICRLIARWPRDLFHSSPLFSITFSLVSWILCIQLIQQQLQISNPALTKVLSVDKWSVIAGRKQVINTYLENQSNILKRRLVVGVFLV